MYPNCAEDEKIRTFKTKSFVRWAKKEKISDSLLNSTINEIEAGLIEADLGAGLVKKRVPKSGQGKRGGYRVLLAFKDKDRSIFIFGFSKNDRENLDAEEKILYKKIAKLYLSAPMGALEKMCDKAQLIEVYHEKK